MASPKSSRVHHTAATAAPHDRDVVEAIPSAVRQSVKPNVKGTALPRGKACLTCRRRKMRCDGQRPVCTQCRNGRREKDCEFDEGRSRSRTQVLMENVTQLERRLLDLQRSNSIRSQGAHSKPARQYDEYSDLQHFPLPLTQAPYVPSDLGGEFQFNMPYDDAFPPFESTPMGHEPWHSNAYANGANTNFWESTHGALGIWPSAEPPALFGPFSSLEPSRETLFRNFLSHQHQLGHIILPTVQEDMNYEISAIDITLRPPLLHIALLWGYRFQDSPTDVGTEHMLLERAQEDISEGLSMSDPSLHTLHAICLLANYLYSSGRLLEGKCLADAASSLAICLNLHSSQDFTARSLAFDDDGSTPPPDGGWSDVRNGLDTFWTVFELGIWSIITGSQPPLVQSTDPRGIVNVPWPTKYLKTMSVPNPIPTVETLLLEECPMYQGESSTSLRAKSAALLQRATVLSSCLSDPAAVTQSFWTVFNRLESCITKCSVALGPLPLAPLRLPDEGSARLFHDLVTVHTHLSTSMILIHRPLAQSSATSQDKCQTWARKVLHTVDQIPENHYSYLHPTLTMCWAIAAEVIQGEIDTARRGGTSQTRLTAIEGELQSLLRGLSLIGKTYPIAEELWQKVLQ